MKNKTRRFIFFFLLIYFSLATNAFTGVGQIPQMIQPLIYYDFDEGAGDFSDYLGINKSDTGVTSCAGKIGNSLCFDGADDLIEYPDDIVDFNFTTEFTISVWVYPNEIQGNSTIINKAFALDSYALGIGSGQWSFMVCFPKETDTWGEKVIINYPAEKQKWSHLVGIYDGYFIRLFVNGKCCAEKQVQDLNLEKRILQQSNRPIAIGNHPSWNGYNGKIDEIGLWKDALNVKQVNSLYTNNSDVKAAIFVDKRLYKELSGEINTYRYKASQKRQYNISLQVFDDIDDWQYPQIHDYIANQYFNLMNELDGILFIGNIKMASFYSCRGDNTQTRYIPIYYEDLDLQIYKVDETQQADFDALTKDYNSKPEIWVAHMPVGFDTDNSYAKWGDQLRSYLRKVINYYYGYLTDNGKFYYITNGKGEDFPSIWNSWDRDKIDYYGKWVKINSGDEKYSRWDLENYQSVEDFETMWDSLRENPEYELGEGWQSSEIFIDHMNNNFYQVVDVSVHSNEVYSLISSEQAKQLENAGLIVTLSGCSVGGFIQPDSQSYVSTNVSIERNIMCSFLYGSSKVIAILGDPFPRGHYAHFPTIYTQLKLEKDYLGHAHLVRLKQLYDRSGNHYDFKEWVMEILIGDPFIDLIDFTSQEYIMSQTEINELILNERQKWDVDNDGRFGLKEAIKALSISAGLKE